MGVGALTVAATAIALSPATSVASARPGSGCDHPLTVTLSRGQQRAMYGLQSVINVRPQYLIKGVVAVVQWSGARKEDIICSARIQRRDGSWVGPTRLQPYQTPTPVGGEYVETSDPKTQYRRVIVKFATSPVRKGANCDYPLMSQAGYSELRDPSVSFRVNAPQRGMDEVAATIHNPNIVICRATAEELGTREGVAEASFEFLRSFSITVGSHGGLSSPVPMPNAPNHILVVKVYSRVLHRPKPPRPKPSGCALESRYYNVGLQTGDTKDFGIKFTEIGKHAPSEPWKLQAEVTIHNSRVTICHATMLWTQATASGAVTGVKSTPVTIGVHGGTSAPVTLPPYAFSPELRVYARRK